MKIHLPRSRSIHYCLLLCFYKALELASWRLRYAGRRVQPYICYRRGCDLELAMFVFLLLMLYPNDTLTRFAKATKTCPAAKRYWRPLNSKRSLPVLKWTTGSGYFLSFCRYIQSKSNHLTHRCATNKTNKYLTSTIQGRI